MRGKRKVTVVEDNGYMQETEVFLPHIRNIIGFLNGEWDLSMYADCFPDKNQLGDVDGSLELHGHTLHVEFKASKDTLNAGQLIKAIRQAKHSNITTIFIFGETNRPVEYLRFSPNCLNGTGFIKTSVLALHGVFKGWAKYAEENSLVKDSSDWHIAKKYIKK
ncbi:hypothetical protein ABEX38_29960 [Priestia megaterium]